MGSISRVCAFCQTPFSATHQAQIYCTAKCRVNACYARMAPLAVVPCQQCGTPMEIRRADQLSDGKRAQRYCSVACRAAARVIPPDQQRPSPTLVPRTCVQCGTEFLAEPSQVARGHAQCCSRHCTMIIRNQEHPKRAEDHPSWKGGRKISMGYVFLLVDGVYVQEHRLVMARHLGRELGVDEVVHHINQDRQDNRLENLQLMSRADHAALHNQERAAGTS